MRRFAHFIIYSKAAAYIAALLYVAVWCVRSVQTGGIGMQGILHLLLMLVVGVVAVRVSREFSFSDVKSPLPATLFFMGCALSPATVLSHGGGAHVVLFSTACYVLLRTYRDRSAMGCYFLAFVLVGIQCLMAPSLLMVLPWLVLGGTFMESLHGRTLLAALWGLLCPYWVMGSMLLLTDRVGHIASYVGHILPQASDVAPMLHASQLWAQLLWTLLLAIPASVQALLGGTMKLQSSAGLRLIVVALVVLLAALWLSPAMSDALFPCIFLLASLVGSSLLTGEGSRAKNIYVIILLALWLIWIGLYVWNSFMTH